ncbi:MAG: hypothetical protein VCD50_05065 [Alphaproteobacteria bacterium]
MIGALRFWTVAILVLVAACGGEAIPPDAPPSIALPPMALAGDADAQVSLGFMYQNGQSFEQSYSSAAYWYRRAAEQGHALAQFALGDLYARGLGLDQDYFRAAYWFRIAALGGNVSAQMRLAHFYENGFGVPRDYTAAVLWYSRASQASRGLNKPPPSVERLAGRAYDTTLLIQPERPDANAPNEIILKPPDSPLPESNQTSAMSIWVHVASFRTMGAAAIQWDTIRKRHTDLLGGLSVELVHIDLGANKGVWVRVQAGPLADMAAAISLCAALQAEDVYCAPVR